MKALITDGFDEEPRPVWPMLTVNAAAPLAVTYPFPNTTGAMTVLPISVASGAYYMANVVWR